MSNTVYIPTPVSELPKEDGQYFAIIITSDQYDCYGEVLKVKDGRVSPDLSDNPFYSESHWLKPIEVSGDSPLSTIYHKLNSDLKEMKSVDMNILGRGGREYQMSLDIKFISEFLPADLARSAHILHLESQVEKLKAERNKIASAAWNAAIEYTIDGFNEWVGNKPDKETYLKSLNP